MKEWTNWPEMTGYNWVRRRNGKPKIVNVEQRDSDGALQWWEGSNFFTLNNESRDLLWKPVQGWKA